MRSKGGSSKGSVLGCTNGLSAIAGVLAVFCAGAAPAARAATGKVAANTPKYTESHGDALSMVRPRAGRNGILRAPSMRVRLAAMPRIIRRARTLDALLLGLGIAIPRKLPGLMKDCSFASP